MATTAEMEAIHLHDAALLREVARRSHGTVLLAFSRGKDSIAAWLALRTVPGLRIIPYHMSLIPGLEFEEASLRDFEQIFGCRIKRLVHPSFLRMIRECVFQPPARVRIITALGVPTPSYRDTTDALIAEMDLPTDTLVCNGVRCADSPYRRLAVNRAGPIHGGTAKIIWNWSKTRTLDTISEAGVSLPVDYELWGRSWDGIDYRFLAPLRARFPRDYARVMEFFPLADLEMYRKEMPNAQAQD